MHLGFGCYPWVDFRSGPETSAPLPLSNKAPACLLFPPDVAALHELTVSAPVGPRSVGPLGKTQTQPAVPLQQSRLPDAQKHSLLPILLQRTIADLHVVSE